ncbi:putative protein serine/threonine kinase [Ancistrocladus abbreviatus]
MLFYRGISQFLRTGSNHCRWRFNSQAYYQIVNSTASLSCLNHASKVLGCKENYSRCLRFHYDVGLKIHHSATSTIEQDPLDPFSIVADELSLLAARLRSMVVAEVPKLASAAEYFFKLGAEGKWFRPTLLLLMATALNVPVPISSTDRVIGDLAIELRTRQQCIPEITEMIHVASLLHDDVLDDMLRQDVVLAL